MALERTFFDHLVVNGTALFTQSFVRHVASVEEQLGYPILEALCGRLDSSETEAALAATFTYSETLDARINGVAVPVSEVQINTLGLAGGLPITDEWRLQATAFWDLPPLNRNHIDSIGGSFTVIRAFL